MNWRIGGFSELFTGGPQKRVRARESYLRPCVCDSGPSHSLPQRFLTKLPRDSFASTNVVGYHKRSDIALSQLSYHNNCNRHSYPYLDFDTWASTPRLPGSTTASTTHISLPPTDKMVGKKRNPPEEIQYILDLHRQGLSKLSIVAKCNERFKRVDRTGNSVHYVLTKYKKDPK